MSDVLVGVDMGTGSSKAVVTNADGQILATATRPRPNSMSMPRPGWAEVDAESVWWGDVVSLCQELVAQLAGHTIAAVCVSGVGPSFLLCDADDRPVRPAILYGIDMRATAEIEELTERYGAAEILARGGTPLTTQAVGPKALWVRRNEPDVWSKRSRLVQLQLVRREAADRRIRSRSPHGQPVRSALRPPRPGVVPSPGTPM